MSNTEDQEWRAYMARLQQRFLKNSKNQPLFTTGRLDGELFDWYIANLPEEQQQYHRCHACRDFITRYGGLVIVDKNGMTTSALWHPEDAPELYKRSALALWSLCEDKLVDGVFLSSETLWGRPHTNKPVGAEWDHFSVTPDNTQVYRNALLTAGQAMAAKREDYHNVMRALTEFTEETMSIAVTLLEADALYRSDKVLGPVKWLKDLQTNVQATHNQMHKFNLIWRAVATAPAGFCHPRSSMAGTLLDDITAGLPLAEVARRFADKMHPLQYQRPQAPPKAGNVRMAEDMIEKLGLARSLQRRFARYEEVEIGWQPVVVMQDGTSRGGVFADVITKRATPQPLKRILVLPPVNMSWFKFMRDVVPTALKMDYRAQRDNYCAIVAPVEPDCASLFQWGNAYNWYRYYAGSEPDNWNLTRGVWTRVTGYCALPWMWDKEFQGDHFERAVLFILDGCVDNTNYASALFPETLRADLHPVRATIEQFSQQTPLTGQADASACGVLFRDTPNCKLTLRVATVNSIQEITIDRWE